MTKTYLSCMVIELRNFKIFPSPPHDYHTSKLQNIAIPAWLSHPTISKFYRPCTWNLFGLAIPLNFFWRKIETMCQL